MLRDSVYDFAMQKLNYHLHCRYNPSLTDYKDILAQLKTDGIAIINDFFDEPQLDLMLEEIARVRKSPAIVDNMYGHSDTGIERIFNIRELAPSTKIFFDHPLIASVFKAYFSKNATELKVFYEAKSEVGVSSQSNFHHFDDWRHRMKAFCYLTDVSAENAPLRYIKKSQKWGYWRFWEEYNYFLHFRTDAKGQYTELTDYSGMMFPHEVETVKTKWNCEEVFCTGKKGTVILFDSRGLHSSTVLQSGERQLLASYWTMKGLGL